MPSQEAEMREIMAFCMWALIAGCMSEADPMAPVARFELDSFVMAPGTQGLKCQTFVNTTGQPMEVSRWEAQITRGGHHVLLFLVPDGEATPLQDCAGIDGAYPILFQSQDWGAQSLVYPEGVAALVPEGAALRVQVHYLNSTDAEVEVANAIELTLAEPGSVRAHVGALRFENLDIHLPPHRETSISRTCAVTEDIELVWLTSHTHDHGVGFRASVDTEIVYDSPGASDPLVAVFDPVRFVPAGSEIEFTCRYDNEGDEEISFGLSLVDVAMCVILVSS
jgi:hypothetical protein